MQKEEAATRQAQPMGQRMDQARARFRRAVEAGQKAQQAMLKAQVNVNRVKSLEALTGRVENMWNPEAGLPPDPLIHAIQESRATLQTSSAVLSQEGGAAMEAETGAEQDPELWDQDEGEAEDAADFEEAPAPGGPPVEPRQTRKAAAERGPMTPQKKTRTAEPEALAKGSAPLSQVQLLPREPCRTPGHGTRRAFATSICFLAICIVAWFCSHARPGRRWPTCFDQTCGYPGEGPLTTLDSPEAPEPSLTPTQEVRTCVVVRRKTKGVKWRNQMCRACESFLTPEKNGYACTNFQTWACSAECERVVVSMHCCRLTGVVSLGSSQSFFSEGLGGSAASGTPRESKNEAQAIDVQVAEVQDDRQVWDERVAHQVALRLGRDRSANADRHGNAARWPGRAAG